MYIATRKQKGKYDIKLIHSLVHVARLYTISVYGQNSWQVIIETTGMWGGILFCLSVLF